MLVEYNNMELRGANECNFGYYRVKSYHIIPAPPFCCPQTVRFDPSRARKPKEEIRRFPAARRRNTCWASLRGVGAWKGQFHRSPGRNAHALLLLLLLFNVG